MTQQLTAIERLLPVLDMAFQAKQVKMAKIGGRIAALKKQLNDLDRPTRAEPLSAANLAGADLRWDSWAHDRKVLINQELALALRDRELVRLDMVAALSKREAAKQLQRRALVDADRAVQRRANW